MVIYDYKKLRGAIKEVFESQAQFALAMGMSESTLSLKLNNKAEWTQDEMVLAMKLIGRPLDEINVYFFTHLV